MRSMNYDGIPSQEFEAVPNTVRPMSKVSRDEAGFEEYGYLKSFEINTTTHKKILITGEGSYIGTCFKKYVARYYPNICCTTIDMRDNAWRDCDFSEYDSVFHVAGIAHADVENPDPLTQEKYYAVNFKLAVETARKAKAAGVRQFILMSSLIIYGWQECIDETTIPEPINYYGDSKWLADKGVRELNDGDFHVAVIRSPMIYGKGSKGNYPKLSKIARSVPCFPKTNNKRSMLYIGNLCEFVSLLIMSGESGIYFPQNGEYSNTGKLVESIAQSHGKRIRLSHLLGICAKAAGGIPLKRVRGMARKAFGSSYYKQKLSRYPGMDYQKYSLSESMRLTENGGSNKKAGAKNVDKH